MNGVSIGLYEKFEIQAGLNNVSYANPYNPDEVLLRAVFTAPSGRTWAIDGFYMEENRQSRWKVRFAPDETGEWTYFLSVDNGASGRSGTWAMRSSGLRSRCSRSCCSSPSTCVAWTQPKEFDPS